ncbi:zf-HC2 domain-containing protein [Catenulispora sp. NF23]|uniref:Zf-HC2 domain-containing protein n=1 Tax=Catenulispora pinistramenti TaxID=2705254 RepID=A0ABS5KQ78_9ACTN|nr:zf-HC2 domain-containing protein [Catenulispora pinistramenti]MBS2536870.1 zf-HC2 domain-containing protein [Catenulispora pinistramenti]MBS2548181.1 zf-HC2 domain-containing protein [Catenulispora pinistramenti]
MGSGHSHVGEQIDSYLTGALTADDERAFERHLLGCEDCRVEADEASAVAVALARVPPEAVEGISLTASPVPAGQQQLTVSASSDGVGTRVRAVAVGMRAGVAFDLLAIGADGREYVAAHGVAADDPQTIAGTVPLPPDQVRLYAVVQGRWDVLLIAAGS